MNVANATASAWLDANQRHLMAAVGLLRKRLEHHLAIQEGNSTGLTAVRIAEAVVAEAAEALPSPSSLEIIAKKFGLSGFERDTLLLTAAPELDGAFGQLLAATQRDPMRRSPTFSLALTALPDAHWSAVTPSGPLRKWRLLDFPRGESLTQSPLRINERTLHFLTGIECLDERLQSVVLPLPAAPIDLPSTQKKVAQHLHAALESAFAEAGPRVIQLCGEANAVHAVVASACHQGQWHALRLRPADVPTNPAERETFARLCEKENRLGDAVFLVEADDTESAETVRTLRAWLDAVDCPILVSGRELLGHPRGAALRFDLPALGFAEQKKLWRRALHGAAEGLNGELDRLAMQFNLSAPAIATVSAEARAQLSVGEDKSAPRAREDPERTDDPPGDPLARALWDSCRRHSRQRLDDLAQRIETIASKKDLVLPPGPLQRLEDILVQVRQRATVYEQWGFAAKSARGLGITALFAGASGTGKTMAAEVLARELRLDLYRIDLSSVVSKYIGETEKNLRRVFDAAEDSGAVLLFDEADALFGKRSEVRDSHDRYANLEVSYLLQRMETYRGLAILTTNQKAALDDAFTRRLRFIIEFPFPNAEHRAKIWQRAFPKNTPTEQLDLDKLARLNVAGGNIRNVALHAAFLAAEAKSPVRMTHLLDAARNEYAKLEKPLMETETRGWV